MRYVTTLACAAGLLGMVAAGPARAQSLENAALSRSASQRADATRGMRPVGEPFTGELAGSASARRRFSLEAGRTYALTGSCDADCRDLDLRLLGPDGTEVNADVETDAHPLVLVVPRASGVYEVRAYMADCRVLTCTFIVQLLAR
jgi:hypothetical protein